MEIAYLGHASFRFKGRQKTVVTDPYGDKIGKFPKDVAADLVTVSHGHFDHNAVDKLASAGYVIDGPGEYEVGGVSVVGINTAHDDQNGAERGMNTVYVIEMEGLRVAHLGDLGHKLTEDQLDEIGPIDIVLLPVGGKFTLDAKQAAEVTRQIDPWIVIPMHYQQAGVSLEGLAGVDEFLKEMGKPEITAVPKFAITAERLPEDLQIVVLSTKS